MRTQHILSQQQIQADIEENDCEENDFMRRM
jgi:hypothetical protein